MIKVTVIGATTWGTTLAFIMARSNIGVTLLARSKKEVDKLQATRQNSRHLPGVTFPNSLGIEWDHDKAMNAADMVIIAVPCNAVRQNIRSVKHSLETASPCILSASKGLEAATGKRISQVLTEELPSSLHSQISVLSGPNLALEIAQSKPASSVVASFNGPVADLAQSILNTPTFRIYTNVDVIGVELAGALKNIIALGAGISDGLGYGNNAKASFIARGLAEITRLGVAAGGDPRTFAGLAGLGDLITTCSGPLSRNWYVGQQLAQGRTLTDILNSMRNVAEGVYTTPAALKMASSLGVDMPITAVTSQVLYEGLDPREGVTELMGRPPRHETEEVQQR